MTTILLCLICFVAGGLCAAPVFFLDGYRVGRDAAMEAEHARDVIDLERAGRMTP